MYHHEKIESKWREIWQVKKTYQAHQNPDKPKYYILDMFPYPSGAGLHVGHVTGYTATDVMARYMRLKNYEVLHPMGWDSFGLPAEQYAIRTGTHPQKTTEKNISTYRRQLTALGFSYDWDREITTSDAKYYKWTQWIFTKLYEKGLAYEAEFPVNFCPALGTVLANEEVEDGKSKEGGFPVERRPLRQWVLKITAYADKLLEDLEDLDWPDHLKRLQRNWIGKSVGAEVRFFQPDTNLSFSAFTTRPDTLFGITYIAIAPEHPMADSIVKKEQKPDVDRYMQKVQSKTEIDRKDLSKEKTGVFTGSYVHHPVTKKPVPIWIADYVLPDYGSGVVMGVPCSDARDFAFAKKYAISIVPIYDPLQEHSPEDIPFSDFQKAVRKGEICYEKEGQLIHSSFADFSLDGLSTKEAKDAAISWLEQNQQGKKAVHYKLRDWLFSRQRYWGEPIPILHFNDGTKRLLDLDELPLNAPPLEDFTPASDGSSPLEKDLSWLHITDEKTGLKAKRETNTMPQWAGSCWYYLRFLDPHNEKEPWSKDAENYWMPVDLYVGGSEHAVLHLLYARFWHKVLYDLNLVHTKEPFRVYRSQGLVTARSYQKKGGGYVPEEEVEKIDGSYVLSATKEPLFSRIEKMSKSKLNGVSPDDIIKEYGADTLRLYALFMGPFDKDKIWSKEAVSGCYRFLSRFSNLVMSSKLVEEDSIKAFQLSHRLAYLVREDLESMQFNTAISHMMHFINEFSSLDKYPKNALKIAAQALYPFAPHLASELWEHLGETSDLSYEPLLPIEKKYLEDATTTYVIQINGKVRANLLLPKDQEKQAVLTKAKELENVQRHLAGKDILKTIFVPNKLVNIVVKPS